MAMVLFSYARFAGCAHCFAVLALVLAANDTHAFRCTPTNEQCFVTIRWHGRNLPYFIRAPAADSAFSVDEFTTIARRSFDSWQSPRCSDMSFEMAGVLTADAPEPVSEIRIVTSGWTEFAEESAVGLAQMIYLTTDGTIQRGRVSLNETLARLIDLPVSGPVPGGLECNPLGNRPHYDIASVLTHEIGHFIGLAHPCQLDPSAEICPATDCADFNPDIVPIMHPRVDPCTIDFRTLTTDDLDALCFLYPEGQRSRGCNSLPESSRSFVANEPFSCAASGAPNLWFTALLLLMLRSGRVKRRCKSPDHQT